MQRWSERLSLEMSTPRIRPTHERTQARTEGRGAAAQQSEQRTRERSRCETDPSSSQLTAAISSRHPVVVSTNSAPPQGRWPVFRVPVLIARFRLSGQGTDQNWASRLSSSVDSPVVRMVPPTLARVKSTRVRAVPVTQAVTYSSRLCERTRRLSHRRRCDLCPTHPRWRGGNRGLRMRTES